MRTILITLAIVSALAFTLYKTVIEPFKKFTDTRVEQINRALNSN